MRPLLIDDSVKARIQEQVAFAERPENWYRPERNPQPPGDDPAFAMVIEYGFSVVYTHTVLKGKHYRHLSVSVDSGKFPHEMAVYAIAQMFGFTGGVEQNGAVVGPGEDWQVVGKADERCVVAVQPVEVPG